MKIELGVRAQPLAILTPNAFPPGCGNPYLRGKDYQFHFMLPLPLSLREGFPRLSGKGAGG